MSLPDFYPTLTAVLLVAFGQGMNTPPGPAPLPGPHGHSQRLHSASQSKLSTTKWHCLFYLRLFNLSLPTTLLQVRPTTGGPPDVLFVFDTPSYCSPFSASSPPSFDSLGVSTRARYILSVPPQPPNYLGILPHLMLLSIPPIPEFFSHSVLSQHPAEISALSALPALSFWHQHNRTTPYSELNRFIWHPVSCLRPSTAYQRKHCVFASALRIGTILFCVASTTVTD